MDAFQNITALLAFEHDSNVEVEIPAVPVDEETGGSGQGGSCVVA